MTYFGILCIMIQIIVLSRKDEILVYRYTPSELKRIQTVHVLQNQHTSCIILLFFLVLSEQKHVMDRLTRGTWVAVESVPSTAVGTAALKERKPPEIPVHQPLIGFRPKTSMTIEFFSSAHLQLWQAWWNLEIALRWLHICTRRGQKQTTKRTGQTHFHVRQRHLSHRSSNCSLQGHITWGRPGPPNNKHLDNLVGLEADLTPNIQVKVDVWSCNTTNTLDQIQLCSKLEFTGCLGPFPHEPRPKCCWWSSESWG